MSAMVVLAALCAAGCTGLTFYAIYSLLRDVPKDERHWQDPLPWFLRLLWPLVNAATHVLGPRLPASRLETAHRQLVTSGQDFVLSPEQLYGLRTVAAAVVIALTWLAMAMLHVRVIGWYALALAIAAAVGWMYPSLWLGERRNKRRRLVIKDLPTFLDFIIMSVEAGLNMTGGIEQATAKGPVGPLNQEFNRLLRDLRSGLPRAEALRRMAERMDMTQISSFTGTLIQADRVGASLGEILRAQASQRREERFLRAEKLALEAPVKMMLPLVMFFFPLIFLMLAYFIYLRMKQEGIL